VLRPSRLRVEEIEPRVTPASFDPFPGSPVPLGTAPIDIVAADLDGDGDTDLAVPQSFSSVPLTILLNSGTGSFNLNSTVFGPVGGRLLAGVAADLDGDGRIDLAVANLSSTSAGLFRNTTVVTADVAVSVTGPASATAGTTAIYAVTVTNTGPQVASLTSVSVPVLPGLGGVTFTSSTMGGCER
jgi:hypothetical protein